MILALINRFFFCFIYFRGPVYILYYDPWRLLVLLLLPDQYRRPEWRSKYIRPAIRLRKKKKVKKRKKSTLHPVAGLSLTEYKPLALAVYLEQSIREVWNIWMLIFLAYIWWIDAGLAVAFFFTKFYLYSCAFGFGCVF